ncbi:MAG: beta-lactamase family protein [Microbacterium sp.]|uniref:serine hydrolase domain-containing protein n=1 Tax=Microbacterium sp. TaxID=51671 RepID=UPI001AD4404F|nr:serine hydrolase domain-containing protein [Microbacterium sp.]MBN9178847.1 beta-lactamase family protein [Microbacterium sp.]
MTIDVKGHADERFGGVVDAFRAGFLDGHPMGAALAVRVDGKPVVDVWAGTADARTGRAWDADTISVIFSCTKGLMSILAAQLVAEGRLSYDRLVARHWPEYATDAKAATTIADLLAHRAGVPAIVENLSVEDLSDWDRCVSLLAAATPHWSPGTAHSYHPITHGWLIGEVIRRVTRQSIGDVFAERISAPLGIPAWIGLPATVEHRVADMAVGASLAEATRTLEQAAQTDPVPLRAMTLGGALPSALVGPGEGFNDPRVRAACVPGAGGVTSARALATIWSATVTETDGVQLFPQGLPADAVTTVSGGEPFFAAPPPWPRWGMGFQLDSPARRYVTSRGFGHDGAGGQVAFAEPDAKVGFAYLTNLMEAGDDRGTRIVDALRAALE